MLSNHCNTRMPDADIGEVGKAEYNGIQVEEYPRVVLAPSFAPSLADVKVSSLERGLQGLLLVWKAACYSCASCNFLQATHCRHD